VARTSRRHEHRAKFGSVLVKLLLTPEDGREELEPDVKAIACAEAELAGVSLASSQPREPDIFCFRQLAGRLEESDRTWLFSMMEQNRCG
jgi:hypothetical protein